MNAFKSCFAFVIGLVIPTIAERDAAAQSWELAPHQQTPGTFWRIHWYERGITNGNPGYDRRFRMNSPEVILHPNFGKRTEARENGLMLIKAEEDLFQVTAAEFYAEMWGGHPGAANKRFTINGRTTYQLPRVGTEVGHCTYFYPAVPLKLTDLVNGYDALQFGLDQGTTFWGHALINAACLRFALTHQHSDLLKLGLADFTASLHTSRRAQPEEGFDFALQIPERWLQEIKSVDFHAWYSGYDDNGNLHETDWHGFTRDRQAVGHVGTASKAPFGVTWDTAMLPPQQNVAIRAAVHFKSAPDLVYLTPATRGLSISAHPTSAIELYHPVDLPTGFWSRANQKKICNLVLEVEQFRIERAELYVVAWTGGAGEVKNYFKLNGQHFPVAEGSRHEVQFNRLAVEPSLLRKGTNTIELLSSTEHHGIEILYPGPALMVRYKR